MASAKFLRGVSYFILGPVVCSLNPAKITFGMESIEDQGCVLVCLIQSS